MNLKNKDERKKFIENYRSWGVWKELPELGVKLYRLNFTNGDCFIVTEYKSWYSPFAVQATVNQKYHLILTQNSTYRNKIPYPDGFSYYEPCGCAIGTLIDYLTKCKDAEVMK